MINRCAQAKNIEIATMALGVLNDELLKPEDERDPNAVGVGLASLAPLRAEFKLSEDRSRIEYCQFGCSACSATVEIEDSDPLIVVSLPAACPESPNEGIISIKEI